MKSINIPVPVFACSVVIIIAPTFEDCSKIARETYEVELYFDSSYKAITEAHSNGLISISILEEYENDFSVLAHEAFHAACRILEYVGDDVSKHTEETLAYLLQYILIQVEKLT